MYGPIDEDGQHLTYFTHCYYDLKYILSPSNKSYHMCPPSRVLFHTLSSCPTQLLHTRSIQVFNKEKVKYNPYKIILNFACKHKGPVGHPSAFAYCNEFKPSRLVYAKQRYGGPFTTSDVEDVKTLTRVFLMILS